MRRVAYLSGRSFRGTPLAAGEVPPPAVNETALIKQAGAERGIDIEVAYWDDAGLLERGYELAVVRTCWDYHERPDVFMETLEAHERAGLKVLNAPAVVRWNARKTYLKDLGDAAIETVWTERADADAVTRAFDALGAEEIVVKPQVGAGSIWTLRLKRGAWGEADLAAGPLGAAMIQPFLRAIETEGERSLFWFGGVFSHAIRKVPQAGDWLANIPGKTRFVAEAAPAAAMAAAEAARARAPNDLLYARVDLVLGDDGKWRVIEIEAIEPYLFLDFAPEGAGVFVDAIARVLG
jgi:glutathione synthase/RimK-type ligase-like ATP-grasp enzyme